MVDEGKGAEGKEGEKAPEGEGKKDPVQARIDAEVARRHKAETELAALKKSQADKTEESLKEQNKFKELYEGTLPKAKLADELETTVKAMLGYETEGLSDEHKALIPEGAPNKQLEWIKKAKAAGVFGKQNNVPQTFGKKPLGGLPPDKWYLEITSDDPRFGTLNSSQYVEWKQHNKESAATPVRGGF